MGGTRSIVGAPPRCEAKSNQYTEPALFAPGAGAPTGGVTRSIVGAPPRCEAKANQNTEPAPFAPGAGAPTGRGDAFDCRSTASVRSEGKPKHRACPVRTRGGCSYRVEVTRSIVGAPPRCEAKSDQHTEPVRSHPGRVLLRGGVARSIVGAPPRCEAKANQNTEPAPFAPGAGAPTRWGDALDCRSTASVRTESNQYTEPALFAPGAGAPTGVARK